jgi:hypothetical protein
MWLLLLAQMAIWEPVRPPVQHQGFWQACGDAERVLEHRVNGYLVYELHMTAVDFGLYAFRLDDGHKDHSDPLNLLSSPRFDNMATLTGGRQWSVPSLKLWVSIVRAGEPEAGCESFYIRIETK